ncbi:putative intermediate filament proteins [Schistosoma mansoni]|uniref:putative intermediate filament proteins n=1 Tax=Schistosoma mansoni TaxID=6183 RepID=UPI00022DBF75|nr:putative intermediate filament proteins [Schistosoma mansoni]|eukprot:XP_018649644.1 putative intermediate filament proteins [Schistosoma mansoni]
MSQEVWRSKTESLSSLDRLARNTLTMDLPEARNCREAREQSRKEMHVLNEKLASQLEKMRILSEQNKKLMNDNGSINRLSKETEKIRSMYNTELKQLRHLVDECEREKADSLAKIAHLQQTIRNKQDQINQLNQNNQRLAKQLDDALKESSIKDADKLQLERHIKQAEEEVHRWRTTAEQQKQANSQLHKNLDEETASRMTCQSEMQTLKEEMEFYRRVHQQEIEELRSMNNNVNDDQDVEHWRQLMQKTIRDIKLEYDNRLDRIREEMEQSYLTRLDELNRQDSSQRNEFNRLQEENSKLKSALEGTRGRDDQLRARCDQLERSLNESVEESRNLRNQLNKLITESEHEKQSAEEALTRLHKELSSLTDAKLNLEAEIAAYSRLLEAQDSLISNTKSHTNDKQNPHQSHHSNRSGSGNYRPRNELNIHVPSYTTGSSQHQKQSHNNVSGRWVEREEPSGQSTRSHHFVERSIEVVSMCMLRIHRFDKQQNSMSHSETFTRGHLVINDCAKNGSYIEILNKGNTEESLFGWCLIRNIDQGRQIIRYTFPNHTLSPHSTVKIWAGKPTTRNSNINDIEAPYSTWGTGSYIQTSLYNPDGLEKATHIQKLQ